MSGRKLLGIVVVVLALAFTSLTVLSLIRRTTAQKSPAVEQQM